jgi:hypothetical protein
MGLATKTVVGYARTKSFPVRTENSAEISERKSSVARQLYAQVELASSDKNVDVYALGGRPPSALRVAEAVSGPSPAAGCHGVQPHCTSAEAT